MDALRFISRKVSTRMSPLEPQPVHHMPISKVDHATTMQRPTWDTQYQQRKSHSDTFIYRFKRPY